MCLILLAFKSHPRYKLILAANRDEYYDRPTVKASFWKEAPDMLAGKDLRAGGTWFGITTRGRIAAITNFREPESNISLAPTRGKLVSQYLLGQSSPVEYLEQLEQQADRYNGFNLIVGEKDKLYWYSNRGSGARNLAPGIYGVSNHLLDTPWPKVTLGKKALQELISEEKGPLPEDIFNTLSEGSRPRDEDLPDTGVGLEWEKTLSPIFVSSPNYGTRSSLILFVDMNDHVTFYERTFMSNSNHASTIKFEFQSSPEKQLT